MTASSDHHRAVFFATIIAGRTILRNKLPDTVMKLEHTILEGSGSLWNGLLYTLRVADIRVQHTQITSS